MVQFSMPTKAKVTRWNKTPSLADTQLSRCIDLCECYRFRCWRVTVTARDKIKFVHATGRDFGYFSFGEVKGLRDRIINIDDLSHLSVIGAWARGGKKKRNGEWGGN